jgi:SAM-dependent methyltransferase
MASRLPRDIVTEEFLSLVNAPGDPGPFPISQTDPMGAVDNPPAYFAAGKSALRLVDGALTLLGRDRESIRSILDFPSGHGRVLRFFRQAFPWAHLTASDIDEEGVRFCNETFDAVPHVSSKNIEGIEFARKFDLIWVGSLLTHVNHQDWYRFVNLWTRSLAPGGILLFTYASTFVRYLAATDEFGLEESMLRRAVHDYDETGFGFAPYQPGGKYGQTFATEQWVNGVLARFPELRQVVHFERGWNTRQNVVAVTLDELAGSLRNGFAK